MPLRLPFALAGRPRPLVVAHRGNCVAAPENTLASFRRALADGADVLETDLHLTRDEELVCVHDASLERTTGRKAEIRDLTLKEVRGESAGMGRPGFEGERVPALAELLELLPGDRGLLLELKTDRFLEPAVCARLGEMLRGHGHLERTAVISFSAGRVRCARKTVPGLVGGVVSLKEPRPRREGELAGPFWPLLLANPLYVAEAHARGMLVAPLDPTPDRRLWLYRLLGCDAVLTNDPAATLRRLGRG